MRFEMEGGGELVYGNLFCTCFYLQISFDIKWIESKEACCQNMFTVRFCFSATVGRRFIFLGWNNSELLENGLFVSCSGCNII